MPDELEALADEFLAFVLQGQPADIEAFLSSRPALTSGERDQLRRFAAMIAPLGAAAPVPDAAVRQDPATGSSQSASGPGVTARLLERIRKDESRGARYRSLGEVARGGMGVILKVWDGELRRTVAMKLALHRAGDREAAPSDTRALARFLDEAQITGQLEHPGIVPVHELGLASDGRAYFTMRLVQGRDLREVFADVRTGRDGWSVTRALGVVLRLCEAMSYAHSKGVVHRDLKPSNVMVGAFGEVYVMDWGLARVLAREEAREGRSGQLVTTERLERRGETPDSPILTQAGDVIGTPSYMAPEQALGELDRIGPHSDVYAVGAILYELIGGTMPHVERGRTPSHRELLERARAGPPPPVEQLAPRVPPELVAICERAMERVIADRYATMQALGDDLRAFLEGRVVRAHRTGTWAETKKWVQRNRALALALASAIVIASSGSIALYVKADQAARSEEGARERAYVANMMAAQASLDAHESGEVRYRLDQCEEARRRNWEWRHLDVAADTSFERRLGLPDPVRAIAFAADDSRVYAGLHRGSIRVWTPGRQDLPTLAEKTIPDGSALDFYALAVSPDGKWVAAGGHQGGLYLIDPGSREELPLPGHQRGILGLAFSPDGRWLASAADEDTVRVWDVESRSPIELSGHAGTVFGLSFSPDGARLASGSADRTVRVWDWRRGTSTVLLGHTGWVRSVAFSSDGSRLASCGDDRTVRLWDVASGALLLSLQGHGDAVRRVCFNAQGNLLASASSDKSIRVWDATSGLTLAVHRGHDASVLALSFAHGSDRLVSGSEDGSIRMWNALTSSASVGEAHYGKVESLVFSSDNSFLASGGQDAVRTWDPQQASVLSVFHAGAMRGSLVLAADAGFVLATTDERSKLVVWNVRQPAQEREIRLSSTGQKVHGISISPKGDLLAICEAFPPDSTSGLARTTIRLWKCTSGLGGWPDVLAGPAVRVLELAGSFEFQPKAFSSDSRLLAIASNQQVEIWDIASGERRFAVQTAIGWALAFDSQGERLFVGVRDNGIEVWDIRSSRLLRTLRGHVAKVSSLACSEDRLASGSEDQTIRIWDAASYDNVAVLRGHSGWVRALAFSPDGARLASASNDRTVRIWHTQKADHRQARDQESSELRRRAGLEVERRLREGGTVAELIAGWEADPDLDPRLRELCIGLAWAESDDPRWLQELVWNVVRSPTESQEGYRRALRRAERVCKLTSDGSRSLLVRGAARLRLGEFSSAIADLERSAAGAPRELDRWPFLAMAYQRAGRPREAEEVLEQLRRAMRTYGQYPRSEPDFRGACWDDVPDLQALLAEAVELIRGDPR